MIIKTLYFDESNISKNDIDDKNFLIASAYIIEDLNLFKEAKKILIKHKINFEIKGSDLMTKKYTDVRLEIIEKIFPELNASLFIYDFFLQKLLDLTANYIMEIAPEIENWDFFIKNHFLLVNFLVTKFKNQYSNASNIDYYELIIKGIDEIKKNKNPVERIPLEKSLLFLKENFSKSKIEDIIEDNYQVLLMPLVNICLKKNFKYNLIIDNFLEQKTDDELQFKNKILSISEFFKTEFNILLGKSENNIGLQIVDWYVSISRKTIKILIEEFWIEVIKPTDKILVFEERKEKWGNQLLKIWRSSISNKNTDIGHNIQLTYEHRSFLEILESPDIDIQKILKPSFLKVIKKKEIELKNRDLEMMNHYFYLMEGKLK